MVSAERPATEEGVQYHIAVKRGDVAPYVLLPGDPERCEKIVKFWDEYRLVGRHRQYVTYTGRYKGAPISVTSTGIGCPATAIAVEELLAVGAHTFIRVGSTGSIQPEVRVGDVIITAAAVKFEGTSRQYAPVEYPAFAHYEVLLALIEAAECLGVRYHVGVTATTDSFYLGQGRPGFGGYMPSWVKNIIPDLQKMKVLNFEMESSTLFTLAAIYGARAGAVHAVFADRVRNEFVAGAGEEDAIRVANEAVKILYEWDELKKSMGKKHFHPSMLLKK